MFNNDEIKKNHALGFKPRALRKRLLVRSLWLVAVWASLSIVSCGCVGKNQLEKAQEYVKEYEANYNTAITLYKALIKQGKDLTKLHLQLGQLYFSHSDFARAKEEFKKFDSPQSRKFLAICNY